LCLDTKNQIIGFQMISRGALNASLVHPREVFKGALLANAYSLSIIAWVSMIEVFYCIFYNA